MPTIPIDQMTVPALAIGVFVFVLMEMAKLAGLSGSRTKSLAALVVGQLLALAHWYVAWPRDLPSLFYAVLVGVAATAMAMGIWQGAFKRVMEQRQPPPEPPTT